MVNGDWCWWLATGVWALVNCRAPKGWQGKKGGEEGSFHSFFMAYQLIPSVYSHNPSIEQVQDVFKTPIYKPPPPHHAEKRNKLHRLPTLVPVSLVSGFRMINLDQSQMNSQAQAAWPSHDCNTLKLAVSLADNKDNKDPDDPDDTVSQSLGPDRSFNLHAAHPPLR